jgi:hypothetical protein
LCDHNPGHNLNDGFPRDIPRLHGPLTPEEKKAEEERERRDANDRAEQAFKDRQVNAVEAANNLSSKSFTVSGITAFIAALACIGTFYQGCMNSRSLQTAQQTLAQIKADATESSKQFQAQLGHFDAGLGRTGLLAAHAGEQVNETHTLAQTSKDALVSVQRAFIFATGFDAIRIGDPIDPNKIDAVEVSIAWENNGTTPTRKMSTHYSYLPSPVPLPDSLFFTDFGNNKPTPIAMGPKTTAHTTPISIPASTVAEIVDHKTIFYIWGWARYSDIFPKSKRHITRFCTAITGFQGNPLNGNPNAISRPVLANCASNCYDDECKVQ